LSSNTSPVGGAELVLEGCIPIGETKRGRAASGLDTVSPAIAAECAPAGDRAHRVAERAP